MKEETIRPKIKEIADAILDPKKSTWSPDYSLLTFSKAGEDPMDNLYKRSGRLFLAGVRIELSGKEYECLEEAFYSRRSIAENKILDEFNI